MGKIRETNFGTSQLGSAGAACVGADDLLGHALGFRLWHLGASHPGDTGS